MKKEFAFEASDGETIAVTTFIEEAIFNGNTLFLVHGFKGFKDWGFWPYIGEYFSKQGYFTVTFNFSHNGIGDNLFEFTKIDKFAKNTFSREIRELNELITAFRENFFDIQSQGKVGLIGHSRGGAISLLTASKRNDIDAVCTWASVANFDRYSKRQKEEWRKKGVFEVFNTRTKQVMRLNIDLLYDIEKNSNSSLNVENAVKNLNCPLLIAHGDQDLAVPVKEAEMIYNWSDNSKTEFFKLFGTGHTFDISHPFAGTSEKLENLLKKTSNFFVKNFNR